MQNGSYNRLFAEGLAMDSQDQKRVEREWLITADYFNGDIPPHLMRAFLIDVDDMLADSVIMALRALRKEPGRRFMPRPPDVIGWAAPVITPEVQAATMAQRIYAALRIGYNHPERAHKHLGDDAWAVVQICDGWQALCQNTNTSDKSNFIAQIRPVCLAQLQGSLQAMRSQLALPKAKVRPPELAAKQEPMQGLGDILSKLCAPTGPTGPTGPQGVS